VIGQIQDRSSPLSAITAGAKTSFLHGADWAYAVGVTATAIGIALMPGRCRDSPTR
jgi:hypothetical protein